MSEKPLHECRKEAVIAKLEEKMTTVEKSIADHNRLFSTIYDLISEIKIMNINIKAISDQQAKQNNTLTTIDSRLDQLEQAPGKKLVEEKYAIRRQVVTAIVTCIITAATGLLLWAINMSDMMPVGK